MQSPLDDNSDLARDREHLVNIKLEAISRGSPLPQDSFFDQYVTYPPATKLGFDEIYVINLERRKERKEMMMKSFQELGMDVKWFKAVDGKWVIFYFASNTRKDKYEYICWSFSNSGELIISLLVL